MKARFYNQLQHIFLNISKLLHSIVVIIFLCLSTTVSYATDVTLAWDANTESDLAVYKIHYGLSSGNYSTVIEERYYEDN